MKYIYLFPLLLISFLKSRSQETVNKPCIDSCIQIAFDKYTKGMHFYIPVDSNLALKNPMLIGYTLNSDCVPDSIINIIQYADIAGKHYGIINVKTIEAKDNPDGFHKRMFICLKDLSSNQI